MQFGPIRNYRTPEGWEKATISPGEKEQLDNAHRARNVELMKECLQDAKRMVAPYGPAVVTSVAVALFERRASHIQSFVELYLDHKVGALRDQARLGGVAEAVNDASQVGKLEVFGVKPREDAA